MNPDEYEFDSYQEEFDFDRFNVDPYESEDYNDDYAYITANFDVDDIYNPLAEY